MRLTRPCLSAGALAGALAATAALLAGSYTHLGPWAGGGASAFAHHPALMSACFTLALPLGLVAYAVELPGGRAGGKAPAGWLGDRHVRRRVHGALSALAAAACLAGWAVAYAVREARGKSHLPWGKRWDKQLHVWGGYAVCAAVTLQSLAGVAKLVSRVTRNARVAPWHGRVGPHMWLLGVACAATGARFSLCDKGFLAAGAATLVALAATTACVLLLLFALPRPCLADSNADRFGGGGGGGGGGGVVDQAAAPRGGASGAAPVAAHPGAAESAAPRGTAAGTGDSDRAGLLEGGGPTSGDLGLRPPA